MFFFMLELLMGLAGLLFPGDRQLDWYRRSFFFPVSAVWGVPMVGFLAGMGRVAWPLGLLGIAVVLPGAPAVWLLGALWIWRSNRRRMREGAR